MTSVSLLKDINTGTAGSAPIPMGSVGSTLFFTEQVGPYAGELFKTDGTLAGTSLVVDARPGPNGTIPSGDETAGVSFNGKFLYPSDDVNGNTLSISDGTAAGTIAIASINNQRPSNGTDLYFAQNLTVFGSRVFFSAPLSTTGTTAVPWITDGTAAGTVNLQQLTGNTQLDFTGELGVLGNKVFFTDDRQNLWQTDGTAAGTSIAMTDFTSSVHGTAFDGQLWAYAQHAGQAGLYETNGTAAGTQLVSPGVGTQPTIAVGNKMYGMSGDPALTSASALWVYDSTAHTATEIASGLTPYSNWPAPFISAVLPNQKVLFEATISGQSGIWSSSGTAATTSRISTLWNVANFNSNYSPFKWGVLGNNAYFQGSTNNGFTTEVFTTDGTAAGTQYFAGQTAYFNMNPAYMTNFGGKLYFAATDSTHGNELWSTDGTVARTGIALDLNTSGADSSPHDFTTDGTKVYFDAFDATAANQPWVTDGTAAGTHMIAPVDPYGQATTYRYVTTAGKTFFSANAGSFIGQFYETDGTAAGTSIFGPNGVDFSFTSYAALNNALYIGGYTATGGKELYKTDGTPAGTSLVLDINPGSGSSTPAAFIPFNSKLVFTALNSSGQRQMYITNGTAAGTIALTSFASGTSSLGQGVILGGKLYFLVKVTTGASIGMQLWATDGTTAGTTLVKQLTTYTTTATMVATATAVYFVTIVSSGSNMTTLWKTDGTTAGTVVVKTLPYTHTVGTLLTTNGKIFFDGDYNFGGYQGEQLFTTDGTAAGTTVLGNLTISDSSQLVGVNGSAYVLSYNAATRSNWVWRSDGTQAGTTVAAKLDYASGTIGGIFAFGNTLYVDGNDGTHGYELMTVNLNDTYNGTTAVDTITLTRDADNLHIDWTDGTTGGQTLVSAANGLTINGGGSNDIINLVYTHGNPLPATLHLDGTFTINGLSGTNPLAGTSLEIGTGTIFLKYASATADPIAAVTSYLKNGYVGGTWTGTATASTGAISSNAAATVPVRNIGIGYADSAGLVTSPANTIELKYTYYGDTGLAGTVGFTDFMRLTQHFTQATGATWGQGDFNYDGTVNAADFNLLKPNYGLTLPAPAEIPIFITPVVPARPARTTVLPPPPASSLVDDTAVPLAVSSAATTKKPAARVKPTKKHR